MGNKVFSIRNLDMPEVRQLAKQCGFTNVSEYVRWCIANGPRLFQSELPFHQTGETCTKTESKLCENL